MATESWQNSLEFSERFENVEKIARSKVDMVQDPLVYARETEDKIFSSSNSYQHYNELLQEEVQKAAKRTPAASGNDDKLPQLPSPGHGQTFGHYARGLEIRNAQLGSSSICIAQAPKEIEAKTRETIVALKISTSSLILPPHDPDKEARILQSLDNSYIVALLEEFSLPLGRKALVFPYVPYTLMGLLEEKRLDDGQVRNHLQSLFKALAYLHAANIIHRDVKPSNILLKSPSGPAYLADFGTAWSPSEQGSEPPDAKITDVGTTTYRPPELMFGNKKYDCTLDLWAAGCTAAEAVCLSTKPLFDGGYYGDSELTLLASMFRILGTPSTQNWPEAASFPDWGKLQFKEFPAQSMTEVLPNCNCNARDLVGQLLRYQSSERISAAEAIDHPYFTS